MWWKCNKSVHCIFKLLCKHIGTVQWARLFCSYYISPSLSCKTQGSYNHLYCYGFYSPYSFWPLFLQGLSLWTVFHWISLVCTCPLRLISWLVGRLFFVFVLDVSVWSVGPYLMIGLYWHVMQGSWSYHSSVLYIEFYSVWLLMVSCFNKVDGFLEFTSVPANQLCAIL